MEPVETLFTMSKWNVDDTVYYKNEDPLYGIAREAPTEPGIGLGWVLGTIKTVADGSKGSTFTIEGQDKVAGKQYQIKEENMHPFKEGAVSADCEDLLSMGDLHQATLLFCLKARYEGDMSMMYTRMGDMVIAINPMKMQPYNKKEEMVKHMRKENPKSMHHPHVWEVSWRAFMTLTEWEADKNHSVWGVRCGEDGDDEDDDCVPR